MTFRLPQWLNLFKPITDLSYHPHIHALIPGGGINRRLCRWVRVKNDYLFNGFALAKLFRGNFLALLRKASLPVKKVPVKWVAHCEYMGNGIPALKYLSKYLYRGVIRENNIVANKHGNITFRYQDNKTGEFRYKTMKGEAFLDLLIKHVLPRGFRRARDYGYLHGKARKIRSLIKLILHVCIRNEPSVRTRPKFRCPQCNMNMMVTRFRFDYGRLG